MLGRTRLEMGGDASLSAWTQKGGDVFGRGRENWARARTLGQGADEWTPGRDVFGRGREH